MGLRKRYHQLVQAWNRDENDAALKDVNALLKSEEGAKFTRFERLRLQSLRFRIAHDMGDEATTFLPMKN